MLIINIRWLIDCYKFRDFLICEESFSILVSLVLFLEVSFDFCLGGVRLLEYDVRSKFNFVKCNFYFFVFIFLFFGNK